MFDSLSLAFLLISVSVCDLGDDRFLVRQQASATLAHAGVFAFPWLDAGAVDDDCEVRHRSQRLLARVWLDSEPWLLAQCGGRFPWVDTCPPTHPYGSWETWTVYVSMAGGGSSTNDYQVYSAATGLMVRDLLRSGWSPSRTLALLREMQAGEIEMRKRIAQYQAPQVTEEP